MSSAPDRRRTPTGGPALEPPPPARRPTGPVAAFFLALAFVLLAAVVPLVCGITAPVQGDIVSVVGTLAGFVVTWLALYLWVTKREGRPFASLGFPAAGAGRQIGLGVLVALVLLAIALVPVVATGQVTFAGGAAALGPILLLFVGFLIQGGAEEVVYRGFVYQAARRRYSVVVALLIQTVAFVIPHVANPGITVIGFLNVVLAGFLFGYLAIATNGLWAPIAAHAVWNWAQPGVFGFNVSGVSMQGWSVLEPRAADGASALVTGGANGIEGMVTAVLALAIVTVFLAVRARRRLAA